jgi:4-amino-4-deoxychorismate lyase
MSHPPSVWIDGMAADSALAMDRGLHYGDGLFETIIVRDGRPRFGALHAARLARGSARLDLGIDAAEVVAREAQRVTTSGVLKIIVTRGDAVERGYAFTGRERPRVLSFFWAGAAGAPATPCSVRSLTTCWGENPALAGLKHLNRLEQVMARRELQALGDAEEGVVYSASGLLASGTMANLFLLRGDELLTPRIDRCGIAGVMRDVVLREAGSVGLRAREAVLTAEDLARATALAFTNVRVGVWAAARLDDRALTVPDALLKLRDRIAALEV